jgi:YD repeat-containing protein
MRGRWWLGLLLAIAVGLLTGCNPIVYLYDEIGRLIAVVVRGGATTVYSYDAVGNITAIDTHPTSQLDVVSTRPRCGSASTGVTIRGTGFGATSSMTVRFTGPTPAGVAATITAGDDTTLVATVPGGAVSGPIRVSNGSSTAESSSFSIPCNVAPAITALVPSLGVAGMPVTVVGSGFQQALFGEIVAFHGTPGVIYASTPTSIVTAVPAQATSGPVLVATPIGSAISATSFEVVPPPIGLLPEDIELVIAMSIGQSRTFTVADPNKWALVRFDGTANTILTVQRTGAASVLVIDPNGQALPYMNATDVTLPVTGRYTLLVGPAGPNGSITITLSANGS